MKYERLTKKCGLNFADKNLSLVDEYGYSYIYTRLAKLEDMLESGELVNITDTLPLHNGRYTRKDSTYYEKALQRLQELENKIDGGLAFDLTDERFVWNVSIVARDNPFGCSHISIPVTEEEVQTLIDKGIAKLPF